MWADYCVGATQATGYTVPLARSLPALSRHGNPTGGGPNLFPYLLPDVREVEVGDQIFRIPIPASGMMHGPPFFRYAKWL